MKPKYPDVLISAELRHVRVSPSASFADSGIVTDWPSFTF